MKVAQLKDGVYRVTDGVGRSELVYVAGPPSERWAFWNGQTFRDKRAAVAPRRPSKADAPLALAAPMPATVLKVLGQPGMAVKKGDAILILEAMKMEHSLLAPIAGEGLGAMAGLFWDLGGPNLPPMAASKEAMEDLRRILAGRAAFYSKADLVVDTSAQPLEPTFQLLRAKVREAIGRPG